VPGPTGLRTITDRRETGGADGSRALALAIVARPRVAFIAVATESPSILLATSDDSGIDAGKLLRPLLVAEGGRGGGSARLAQGSAPDAAAADRVASRVIEVLTGQS